MSKRGHNFSTLADLDIVREIKEKMCYTVTNYDEAVRESEETHAGEKNYDLPDGKKILLGNEKFKCPEALF